MPGGTAMLMNHDRYLLTMSRLGELRSTTRKLVGDRAKAIATLTTDLNHSALWKAGQREELDKAFNKAMAEALEKTEELQRFVTAAEVRAGDPVMALFGHRVPGAITLEGDAAAKAEFRALMTTLPTAARRTWLDALLGEKDWGRVGVLLALDPALAADAKGLDLPGRDQALKESAELKAMAAGILADERVRKAEERSAELYAKARLTESEGHELVRLGNELTAVQQAARDAEAHRAMSAEDAATYLRLNAMYDSGQALSPQEGHELVRLGSAQTRADDASKPTEVPKPLTAAEDSRYSLLSQKADSGHDLTRAEGLELVGLAQRVQDTI